jgi:hypothetical protein
LISGAKTADDTDGRDIFILQLDQDRHEVWSGHFGGPLDEFGAAFPLTDGGYILGGVTVDPDDIVADPGAAGYGGEEGRSNIYLSRIEADGSVLWSRSFGGDENVLGGSAVPTPEGGYLVLATISYFPESGNDLYLLKVDQDGNEVWSKTWEDATMDGYDLIPTSDGNYLISAAYSTSDNPANPKADYLFIKIDPEGNEIWSTIFGDPEMIDFSRRVVETADGGFVGAGEWTKDLYGSGDDISLVKLDSDGEVLWQNRVPMGVHNMLTNLLQHPDGGFVIGGSTVNGGYFDLFLIKADSEGNIE